ncbi:50S ribosomal protein L9, partial [candidate division WOR-3 bacterium]|nr:50S ribosomal protein L9 [candidate division WOR-3 bacterium]
GHEVDKHSIVLAEPIKGPGVYDIPVKLGHEVSATVKLWVAEEPA